MARKVAAAEQTRSGVLSEEVIGSRRRCYCGRQGGGVSKRNGLYNYTKTGNDFIRVTSCSPRPVIGLLIPPDHVRIAVEGLHNPTVESIR